MILVVYRRLSQKSWCPPTMLHSASLHSAEQYAAQSHPAHLITCALACPVCSVCPLCLCRPSIPTISAVLAYLITLTLTQPRSAERRLKRPQTPPTPHMPLLQPPHCPPWPFQGKPLFPRDSVERFGPLERVGGRGMCVFHAVCGAEF